MIRLKCTQAWYCVLLSVISVSLLLVNPVYGAPAKKAVDKPVTVAGPSRITADATVLMDVATGDILFSKQAHKRRPPASTTKIMTAILGFELGRPEEVVTVSDKAAAVGESTIYLDPGEKITLYELITGALVRSGNDACVAIAEHIAGSEEQFVKFMNRKALALGAENTNFINTNGLPRKEHYSTAYDLALMARYGLQIPQFQSITRQKETEIHFIEPDVFMDVRNTNKLLWNYPYADGIKTGTTTAAGKCLVASATKEGRQLLVVVLNAPDRFGDAKKLLEWGFQNTETVRLAEVGQVIAEFPHDKKPVKVFTSDPLELSLAKANREKLVTRIEWEKPTNSTIHAGERLGRFEVWLGEQKIKSVPLISENEVQERSFLKTIISLHWRK
ncbi:D-alanyl-D-alanine carboxypeptidase family protein [Desulfosporosinus sp.]|uniref:D-alanyl-D-alanine carboxypeptidase family protein n=1 Tax=Desulfosporosinus sp. TaxID=157907 RepID=UPI000E98BBAD|nr:D-alanyl-D-alanine carboxypeptidase family protein [Desulfosporosinus sp.]MBC2722004.1 D-alanyl-D-alanine carboxypeptidase [Desulfosporosinus sp.]MBC2728320.1 D-alanyl-D-alanine carboxypeptidase [Desulfosporosinus sp.]HBV87322.1 D-alanyl-D-alanine carboxypeptidase [Desulfosporosinus sp.]